MTVSKFNHCSECRRLLKDDETVCPHCGTIAIKRRPDPVREALVELMAATTAGSSADGSGYQTERIDSAMQQAELALRPTTERPPHIILEPKSAFKLMCHAADSPPLTCVQFLELARDSMDAADAELQAANKTASGMASLLLLDMIRESGVMAARIRAILRAASNEAGVQIVEIKGPPMPAGLEKVTFSGGGFTGKEPDADNS